MITREQIDILLGEPAQSAIAANIDGDPFRIALDKRLENASLIALQVKYLQKARAKLPSFYKAGCIIPPLAFEQSSSEAAASRKGCTGKLCIDLTCGLGVDAFWLSGKFDRVVTVEKDPVLAYLAEKNFKLLGVDNISVVNCPAEDFLKSYVGPTPDMIYADPDRRSAAGKKLVRLGDCSPDISVLLPVLRSLAPKVIVKLSPLFDIDEAFRIFGGRTRVEVVSLDGECKEIVVETDDRFAGPIIAAVPACGEALEYPYLKSEVRRGEAGCVDKIATRNMDDFKYLVVPDVALAKAGIARRYYRNSGVDMETENSYGFSVDFPATVAGKVWRIEKAMRYSPAQIKKELALRGARQLNVFKKDFPYRTSEIIRQLGIREGGTANAAFTRYGGDSWCLFIGDI